MAGSIMPLPVLLDEEDQKIYDRLQPPKTMVVRYGDQKLIAELPYDGDAKPGCGSKLVIRTSRGIELATMLTTTCANSGCSKSVSRKEMLEYIDNSGGKQYPFTTQGRVLRVATIDDLNEQARLDARKPELIRLAKQAIIDLKLPMKLVDVELLLGGERIIFYYLAEQWVDFRELVKVLAGENQTRIEMHQVNDREEARLVADYERCGQYCCCKNFLKVLKPISMRSAKVQKATLDPTKISGRCGRLMCCLRYEDETYEDLRKKLPHRKTVVETEDGIGEVNDTQILTQLVLVWVPGTGRGAYPLENIRILDKEETKAWRFQQKEAEAAAVERAMRYGPKRDRPTPPGSPGPGSPGSPGSGNAPGAPAARQGGPGGGGPGPRREGGVPPSGGGPRPGLRPQGRRDEPRRPMPGKPLRDGEIESREGLPSGDLPEPIEPTDVEGLGGADHVTDDVSGETGEDTTRGLPPVSRGYGNRVTGESAGGPQAAGDAGAEGGEGAGKKRRRRRRRRGRGRGPGGGEGGEGGGGGDGAPSGGEG